MAAAKAQLRELPAAETKSALAAELASEMLRTRKRIAELDRRLEDLLAAGPEARIVSCLPGMGVVFTAELLAEAGDLGRFASANSLAAAAGIAPVLRASAASHRRRARRGNKVLERVLYPPVLPGAKQLRVSSVLSKFALRGSKKLGGAA